MGVIKILDPHTANQIAAGEVVERPASVIKELVENAIDAGATSIEVAVMDGGLKSIVVKDNGSGIQPDDILLAFERHATSKISTAEDLGRLTSLGFRGEALPSIASVARVEGVSRPKERLAGRKVIIHGGHVVAEEDAGCAPGTSITVADLFFNTPARRKHLKSTAAEAAQVNDIVTRLALAHPEINFKLSNNGKVVFHTPAIGDLIDTIRKLYGNEVARELVKVEYHEETVAIVGYVVRPVITRNNRQLQTIIVNGRYVKSKIISQAVLDALHTLIPVGRHPIFVLRLDIAPDCMDANVHPTKMEIRFDREDIIVAAVKTAVSDAINHTNLVPGSPSFSLVKSTNNLLAQECYEKQRVIMEPNPHISINTTLVQETKVDNQGSQTTTVLSVKPMQTEIKQFEYNLEDDRTDARKVLKVKETSNSERLPAFDQGVTLGGELSSKPMDNGGTADYEVHDADLAVKAKNIAVKDIAVVDKAVEANRFFETSVAVEPVVNKVEIANGVEVTKHQWINQLRPIGQVSGTYILCQGLDGLVIIDQHAAHERILYEEFISQSGVDGFIQDLLIPITLELSPMEAQALVENIIHLRDLGFIIEHFGGNGFLVRGVPQWLSEAKQKETVLDILGTYLEERKSSGITALREKALISMSCKAAIKAGEYLPQPVMEEIILGLARVEQPHTCPHGRPTMIQFSQYELERRFKRV